MKKYIFLVTFAFFLCLEWVQAQAFYKESPKSTISQNIVDLFEWPDGSILIQRFIGNTTQRETCRNAFVRLSSSGDTLAFRDWVIEDGDSLFSMSMFEGLNNRVIMCSYAFNDDSLYIIELDTNLIVTNKVGFFKGNGFTPFKRLIKLSSGNYVLLTENYSGDNIPLIRAIFIDPTYKFIKERQFLYRTQVGDMAYDPVNQKIYVTQTAFFDSLVYFNYFRKPATVMYDTNFIQLKAIPNQPMWTFDSNFPIGTYPFNTGPIIVNSQNIVGAVNSFFTTTPNWVNFYTEKDIMVFNYNLTVDSINKFIRLFTPNEYDGINPYATTISKVNSGDIYCGFTSKSGQSIMPGLNAYFGDQWVTLSKLNSNLQLIWQKQFKSPPGVGMYLTCVLGSRDNGVIFAGASEYSNQTDHSTFIGKTDLWGGVVANVAADRLSTVRVEAFPNPAEHQLSWQAENPQEGTMTIRDLQGKAIWEASISLPHTAAIHHFAAGLYTWHFISNDGKQASGKWVKR